MRTPNLYLFLPAILLSIIGLVVVYSISPDNFNSQLTIFILGLLIFLILSQIDFNILSIFSPYLYLLQILLLVITFIFGAATRGSTRWISLGQLNYQASEFTKPFLILLLANISSKLNLTKITGFMFFLSLIILPAFLVFIQPDLGSSLIISAIGFYLLISSKVSNRFIFALILVMSISIPIFMKTIKPYQLNRIENFLNPKADPLGSSYNQIQAVIAAGSGQFYGKGLGKGTQSHLQFLPEKHTDFIFASLSEEFGFIGSFLVLILFFAICSNLIYLSKKTKNTNKKLIFTGVFILLILEAGIHIGINIGILPVTGIPLPFLSVGGSSAIATWISLAIASSASGKVKDNKAIYLN